MEQLTYSFDKIRDLTHGENPQQNGSLYKTKKMADYELLKGSELSFNDILNITQACDIVSEFYDVNCTAIIRHRKPCGVALGRTLYDSYTKAFDCDPIGSFYATVGFSKSVDEEVAKHLNSMSVRVVIAPDFDENALKLFQDNSEIKLVKLNTPLKNYKLMNIQEIYVSPFGALIQDKNLSELNKDTFEVVTKNKPTAEQIEDAVFAWKVAKYSMTDSVVVAKDFKCSAISQGYTNILAAVEGALDYSCDNSKSAVLASDTVIESEDCIYAAAQGRIGLIIQPGGSIKDNAIAAMCDKYNIAMITTGIRNYRQ